ncbi:MAG: VWA domain-containing protein [Chloroflexota bacterium]
MADDGSAVGGELTANLLHFGRLLRQLGIKAGTDQIGELARGLRQIDFTQRDLFYYAARSYLVKEHDQIELFDQAFELFWAGRQQWMLEFGMTRQLREGANPKLPESKIKLPEPPGGQPPSDEQSPEESSEISINPTYSAVEIFRAKLFEEFTDEEMQLAKAFVHRLRWSIKNRPTRRLQNAPKRARYMNLSDTVRHSMAYGGEIISLDWRRRKVKPRPLIVVCDISGSMDRYSRIFLHFVHTLAHLFQRVEVFVFGTRLTRITRALKYHRVDDALDDVAGSVIDWAGGTRIGESLRTFNYEWSRRVLGRGAIVMIISDGWDRGDIALLESEIGRLRRSVSRLVWLNPLAGSPTYEPLAKGIKAVLPYCDDFLPLHNLRSLEDLALLLGSLDAHN